jgi:hypothetical protein
VVVNIGSGMQSPGTDRYALRLRGLEDGVLDRAQARPSGACNVR